MCRRFESCYPLQIERNIMKILGFEIKRIKKTNSDLLKDMALNGHYKLDAWFGLTYASWLILPRVLLMDMPDEWKLKMAELLEEIDATYPNAPNHIPTLHVSGRTSNGKFLKIPEWLSNYRHPDHNMIAKLKGHFKVGDYNE